MSPELPQSELLADKETGLLREGVSQVSQAGRFACLSRAGGRYQGARPYFTVYYFQRDGRTPQVSRFTPFLGRAEEIFVLFLEDRIDPEVLRPPATPAEGKP